MTEVSLPLPTLNTWISSAPEVEDIRNKPGFENLTEMVKADKSFAEKRTAVFIRELSQIRQREDSDLDEEPWQSSLFVHFEPYLTDLKVRTHGIWLHYLVYLARRLALVGAAFFLNSFPVAQITLFTVFSFLNIMFTVLTKPH